MASTAVTRNAKVIAGAAVAIPAWGAAAYPGGYSAGEWWGLAGILGALVAVWLTGNADPPAPWRPPSLPQEGGATGASGAGGGGIQLNH